MQYTWGDIQLMAIQKMFLNNNAITIEDLEQFRSEKKYALYLNAMPEAANEALLRIMNVGTPLVKQHLITYDVPNAVVDYQSHDVHIITNEDLIIDGGISKSYYFEVSDDADIEIQHKVDGEWQVLTTIEHSATAAKSYEALKGIIENEDNNAIRLVFKASGYLYNVRNIALYNISFRLEEDVYENTLKQVYELNELISDFYEIISVEYERDGKRGVFDKEYLLEGDNRLVIDSKYKGNFIIKYKAYPTKITADTDDSYKFNIPAEMAVLIPTYIASELYKDDDIALATVYRNQFEVALSEVKAMAEPLEFADTSGWL